MQQKNTINSKFRKKINQKHENFKYSSFGFYCITLPRRVMYSRRINGACISTSKCSQNSGTSHKGHCKGNKSIQCCTGIKCDGGNGVCGKEGTCSGNEISGKCPGPSNFKCCTSGKSIKPDDPKPHGSGEKIVSAARSMTGKYVYSWGGGNINGASHGSIQPKYRKCDDRKVVGFDCSGLSLYAVYQGTGVKLSHSAKWQYLTAVQKKKTVPIGQVEAGDLVFFGDDGGVHHVAIYSGNGQMIEAEGHDNKCRGLPLHETTLRKKGLMPKAVRYW